MKQINRNWREYFVIVSGSWPKANLFSLKFTPTKKDGLRFFSSKMKIN